MSNKINSMMCLTMMVAILIGTCGHAKADFTFGDVETLPEPINLPGISSGDLTMTADGLEAYFVSINRPGGCGREDIWVCRRESPKDGWGPAVNLGPPVNTSACDSTPSISADGLELYFSNVGPSGSTYRTGEQGGGDIWVTKRTTREDDWDNPVNLGPTINSSSMETYPNISADGLSLYFSRGDILVTTRARKDDDWGSPVRVTGGVNSGSWEGFPNISADGRVLFFYSDRSSGYGGMDIYMTMRATVFDSWEQAVNLGPMINTPYYDISPSLSVDGCTLHFAHNDVTGWNGHFRIYRTTISPVVDFNGDGVIDALDMCIMVDHWGTNEPLCDIGPMPWGDGIVDVQDLIVLAEHLFEDYRMIAHWKLDEEVGDTAHDSLGDYNGTLYGGSLWQPEGGVLDGALEFDGNDDYINIPFVLNPGQKSFSSFTWIKGGASGQVIISQRNTTAGLGVLPGCTWLGINPSEGRLMTGLMDTFFGPLESDSIITDGQWHHIGLVYDIVTMRRHLYLDGAEVAVDADFVGGVQTTGDLYIGAGQALDVGTFFSGLVDDVRVYNTALTAEEIAVLSQQVSFK